MTDTAPDPSSIVSPAVDPLDWSIEWMGSTWRKADMTGDHAAIVATMLGDDSWSWLDPQELNPGRGPLSLVAVVVACQCVDLGIADPERVARVARIVMSTPIAVLMDALRVV